MFHHLFIVTLLAQLYVMLFFSFLSFMLFFRCAFVRADEGCQSIDEACSSASHPCTVEASHAE